MYKKYLLKPFDVKNFDCVHLAALYLQEEFGIDTNFWGEVSREYDPAKAGEIIHEQMLKIGNMIEVDDKYKQGDILIYYPNRIGGGCAICVDDKIALIMLKKSTAVHINKLENIKVHLRHKSLIGVDK